MREKIRAQLPNIGMIFFGIVCLCLIYLYFSSYLPKNIITIQARNNVAEIMFASGSHIKTPSPLKAVYMTSWSAGSEKFRKEIMDLVDKTEINAVVIDVKDYTGRISFYTDSDVINKISSSENRIPDIESFIAELHDKNVYVIGRISSFQDSFLVKVHPEWAVRSKSGDIWRDRKGVAWLEAGAKPVWDYLVEIGKASYKLGFDELNFDYVRFPSDGNMQDIDYKLMDGKNRREVMKEFFSYLKNSFKDIEVPISVDLFGYTTTNSDDLGIGQVLEDALTTVDFVCPMVYPSHYGSGFIGIDKPAKYPYEVVKYSMQHAVDKALNASSSPAKLRPWLQSFDLGAEYTPAMVRAQMQAVYDAKLDSWMLWNAGSEYNEASLIPKSH